MPRRFRLWLRRAARPLAQSRGGFTIVEVVVAIMIFTVGLLAMAGAASRVRR